MPSRLFEQRDESRDHLARVALLTELATAASVPNPIVQDCIAGKARRSGGDRAQLNSINSIQPSTKLVLPRGAPLRLGFRMVSSTE